jgi:lipopolysaccharide transport system permease protein
LDTMIAKAIKFIHYNPRREIDLLCILTREQITLQYKRTWLGIIWSLLNPLLLACIFYIAFTIVLKVKSEDFSLFLLAGLFPWTWFNSSVSASTVSLISNKSLIKKFPFPKPFLLISGILSEGVHFLFSLPIIILLGLYYGKSPGWIWLVGIPILLLTQFLVTLGVSLAVSVINVYFRDFQFVVNFGLTLLFWLTPIIYQLETVPEAYRPLFLYVNPLTSLIISWRELFLRNHIRWDLILLALLGSVVVLLLGVLIYQKFNKRVDELL